VNEPVGQILGTAEYVFDSLKGAGLDPDCLERIVIPMAVKLYKGKA
jgi:hypothetical protein